jgi:hypothetical protein
MLLKGKLLPKIFLRASHKISKRTLNRSQRIRSGLVDLKPVKLQETEAELMTSLSLILAHQRTSKLLILMTETRKNPSIK